MINKRTNWKRSQTVHIAECPVRMDWVVNGKLQKGKTWTRPSALVTSDHKDGKLEQSSETKNWGLQKLITQLHLTFFYVINTA